MMDEDSFKRYADTYGGDLSRWPREVLPAAATALQADPRLDAVLAEAWEMDKTFQDLPAHIVSPDLRARIRAIPHDHPATPMFWLKPRHWVPAMVVCGLLGLVVGVHDPIRQATETRNHSAWLFAPEQTISLY